MLRPPLEGAEDEHVQRSLKNFDAILIWFAVAHGSSRQSTKGEGIRHCSHGSVKKRGDTAAVVGAEGVPKGTPQCPRVFSQVRRFFQRPPRISSRGMTYFFAGVFGWFFYGFFTRLRGGFALPFSRGFSRGFCAGVLRGGGSRRAPFLLETI